MGQLESQLLYVCVYGAGKIFTGVFVCVCVCVCVCVRERDRSTLQLSRDRSILQNMIYTKQDIFTIVCYKILS